MTVPICETVTGGDSASLRAARDAAAGADLVEVRLDTATGVGVASVIGESRAPLIATCRPVWEGGMFAGPEHARLALLEAASARGAAYVDVEWRAERSTLPSSRSKVILSLHDFSSTPGDLDGHIRVMAREAHDVLKIATIARDLTDCVRLRDATADVGPRLVIGMGEGGLITRVCPWLFGSAWVYAGRAAPGQLTLDVLIEDFRLRETSPDTLVVLSCGDYPDAYALAVAHNHAFRARSIDAVSVPVPRHRTADVTAAARAFGIEELFDVPAALVDLNGRAARDADRLRHAQSR
jgi:3-dehydroquinate dehydratase-1